MCEESRCPQAGGLSEPDLVNLDQTYAASAPLAGKHSGVLSRRKRRDNRGLSIVRGRYSRRFDLALLCVPPVVVKRNRDAVAVVQLERRIVQWLRDTCRRVRTSDPTLSHLRLAAATGQNK